MTDRRQPNTFNIIGWGQSLSSNLKRIFLYGAIGVIVKWLRNNTAKTLRVATEGESYLKSIEAKTSYSYIRT